jgi:DNA (cytosine-5)-methyltransferase 1
VPQNRERVFIIGHLRGEPRPKVFPFRGENKRSIRQSGNLIDDSDKNFKNPQVGRVYNSKGLSPCLNTMQGGDREPKILQEGLNTTEEDNSFCIDSNYHKGTSPGDINSGRRTQVKVGKTKIRKLTPLETFRLQGFPDEWYYKCREEGISDTQLYRAVGDSVTVNVVQAIAGRLSNQ